MDFAQSEAYSRRFAFLTPVTLPRGLVDLATDLREIEERAAHDTQPVPALAEELKQLELRVGKITIPLSYADELYALRNHIELVRKKLLAA